MFIFRDIVKNIKTYFIILEISFILWYNMFINYIAERKDIFEKTYK